MAPWLLWLILAQAADASTTVIGMRAGCRESTWPSGGAALAGKGATIGISVAIWPRLNTDTAKTLAVLGIISGAVGTAVNLTSVHGGCR